MSAFLKLANRRISAPASTAGKHARTTEEKEKVLAECAYTLRAWKRWRAEQREAALTGAHGALIAQLLEILDALTLRNGARLVEFIRAQDWGRRRYQIHLLPRTQQHDHEIARAGRHVAVRRQLTGSTGERVPPHQTHLVFRARFHSGGRTGADAGF